MKLQPPATLLIGETGSGKTDSLLTLVEAGIELFVIITEPDGVVSLVDSAIRRKLPIDKLHWATAAPATLGWQAMTDMVNTIGSTSYEDIAKIKGGVGKSETRKPAMKLLDTLSNFRCERDGQPYGDFTQWDDTRALVLDSQSGLNLMAMALTIGYKPAAHQGEWGVAMNFVEQLILKLTSDRQCYFVLTAHIEKELNEITGTNQITISTLGRKLAPKIPRFFSEVVWTKKVVLPNQPPKWIWSTADANAALKNRVLPTASDLQPSFKPIVDAYERRKSVAGATTSPAPQQAPVQPKPVVPPVAPLRPQATTYAKP